MPSTYYTVSITATTGASPSDGFIDPTNVVNYMAAGSAPSDLAHSTAKTRANVRYLWMVHQLQIVSNIYVQSFVATGANANTAPSAITFTLAVEHGDGGLRTPDETNAGTFLTSTAAIKRFIARALCQQETSYAVELYDPTATGNPAAIRNGLQIVDITVGAACASIAAAEATITVTKVI